MMVGTFLGWVKIEMTTVAFLLFWRVRFHAAYIRGTSEQA